LTTATVIAPGIDQAAPGQPAPTKPLSERTLWLLVGLAVFAVAIIAGLIALGTERDTDQGNDRLRPVSRLLDAPIQPAVVSQPETKPLPSRTAARPTGQAQAPAGAGTPAAGGGGGDTDVTISNGTSSTETESGGAHVSNNADVDANAGVMEGDPPPPDEGNNPPP
jgi:hypothetical protein